jgi:hypothetical protein
VEHARRFSEIERARENRQAINDVGEGQRRVAPGKVRERRPLEVGMDEIWLPILDAALDRPGNRGMLQRPPAERVEGCEKAIGLKVRQGNRERPDDNDGFAPPPGEKNGTKPAVAQP